MSKLTIDPKTYPLARRDDSIADDFHGTKIADPYRWMEDPDATETQAWVTALNKISEPVFNETDIRPALKEKLSDLWNYEKFGCTGYHNGYYFYWHNSGLQNQSVLYKSSNYTDKGEIFFDPNGLSEDGTTALRNSRWTEDGKIWCYGLSHKGSDWMTLHFKTIDGKNLTDTVPGVKHSSIAWLGDNSGVFYSRYPGHKSATEGSSVEKHEYHSLYFHKLGTPSSEDFLVADFRSDPNLMHAGEVSSDGRLLIVDVSKGCDPTNQVFYYDLDAIGNKVAGKLHLKPLFDRFNAKYDVIDSIGDHVLVKTNLDSPMFKLIRVKLDTNANDPANWETIIPEDPKRKLDFVGRAAGEKLIVGYLEDCCSKAYVVDQNTGKTLHQIPLEIGTLSGLSCHHDRTEVFFSFESYLTPTIVYRFDLADPAPDGGLNIREVRRVQIKSFDPTDFVAEQVFATSKDGTRVPMFVIRRKNMTFDGQTPLVLNGYGGFNLAEEPYFSISRVLWLLSLHGAVACSNLRGGSEYGEKWHEAGMLHNKQNVFDDFIACAEYLIAKNYTSPAKLAIQGGSNGGLLVGAVSQQRPDLFGAVVNRVGVNDMLRFHKFTVGAAWLPEYGNPDVKADFEYIYKYSPLHNVAVRPDGEWPATLLMTADHDDRVVPSHTLKYIAQIYHVIHRDALDRQKKPVICRVEVKAGHGAGKPTSKIIDEIVDIYSFLYRVLEAKFTPIR